MEPVYHLREDRWLKTSTDVPRGYIQPLALEELWFHTGTCCNLSCSFCFEGSHPGDDRVEQLAYEDAEPLIHEALGLGVQRFSFTGGEPFMGKDFTRILSRALDHRPGLVLTNGTEPLQRRWAEIIPLLEKPNELHFRVSIDCPDAARHDAGRGEGRFEQTLQTLTDLHHAGFAVTVARQLRDGEDTAMTDAAFRKLFTETGLPADIRLISFPDLLPPGDHGVVPEITENCMTAYQTEETRSKFMCAFSKMVVKQNGQMRLYPCTLVDDDPDYDLGSSLSGSMQYRIMLRHHRCYACFSCGTSCSEG